MVKELKTKCFNCKATLYQGKFVIYGFNQYKYCTIKCALTKRLEQQGSKHMKFKIKCVRCNKEYILKARDKKSITCPTCQVSYTLVISSLDKVDIYTLR